MIIIDVKPATKVNVYKPNARKISKLGDSTIGVAKSATQRSYQHNQIWSFKITSLNPSKILDWLLPFLEE